MGEEKAKKWWHPLLVLLKETFGGSIIFVVVAIPAIGINYSVHWLERQGIDSVIIVGLTMLEYTLFSVDAMLFIFFIVKSAIKAGQEL